MKAEVVKRAAAKREPIWKKKVATVTKYEG